MKSLRWGSVVWLVLALGPARPAAAQWSTLGAMPSPRHEQLTLTFQNRQGIATVSVVTPEVVRVRFSPAQRLGRDHSYAVADRTAGVAGSIPAQFDVTPARSRISTAALRVSIQHAPFRVTFADAADSVLDRDDPQQGIAFSGRRVQVSKQLRDDEHVYGLGEKNGRLDKRGRQLGGYTYAMWNSDTFAYGTDTDPIYVSIPFVLVLRNGVAHGIFFDNTFRSYFDVGHAAQGLLTFGADGGELDYYFIAGPSPKQVIERYTAITGRLPLPPRWALGYHQCRYSYYPDSKVRFIADNFRARRIPADVIWLDIHYLDNYKPFTWDRQRFPDPAGLIAGLKEQGFRIVTIIDPHPKKEPGSVPYDTGLAGGHFVRNPDGSVYEAPVWPSQAEHDPGPSVFPDFSRPATREWWGGLYKSLLDVGVAGIWNDMNEPAVFQTPTGTMPLDVRHDNEGEPTDHREIHNVYGALMAQATYEGLRRLRPDDRPFVLTRASFAGGQRFAAVWPGDNVSDWEHLRASLPLLMGMGLSGLSFVGSDIGGFAEAPSAELFTRWLQTGVFYPFMRAHTALGTPDQEPWSYGTRHEAVNRQAIELRYQLLPHIYHVMREASATGVPALRPLLLEFPEDPRTYQLDDQFMFGSHLLVAPVLREGVTERSVYLPRGEWFSFWTGQRYSSGDVRVPVDLTAIPLFVRAGGMVFSQPVVQHTGEMTGQPLIVTVFPADDSESVFYEDDGRTMGFMRGAFVERRVTQRRSSGQSNQADRATILIGGPEGSYRPPARDLLLRVRWEGEPARVLAGIGSAALAELPRRTGGVLENGESGWAYDPTGFVLVRDRDRFEQRSVVIEGR